MNTYHEAKGLGDYFCCKPLEASREWWWVSCTPHTNDRGRTVKPVTSLVASTNEIAARRIGRVIELLPRSAIWQLCNAR